jgi:hypothetical protein
MNNQAPVPSSWIQVPDSPLYFDPATQSFMTHGDVPQVAPNQWSWGDMGLGILGQADPLANQLDSFLSIKDEYRAGAPITADTWQDAVRQSLTGFMRANYGTDPVFNWNEQGSGNTGSQFRLGTFEELANNLPGFFDTTGNLVRNAYTGGFTGQGGGFDPLLGLNPQDKLLGFEDVPFEQIEKMVGSLGLPHGKFFNQQYAAPLQQRRNEILRQMAADPTNTALHNEEVSLRAQLEDFNNPNLWFTLAQAQANPGLQDFNDFLFKLDINQYAPPAPIIRATPESVLEQFFDTAPYRLAFGNDPGVLDASLDPTERFRFDPGYQFAQDEGLRQLQFDQSKRGLLESGRGMRDIEQFSQGLADQNYQRNLAQNMGLFSDWTNRIQGVAGAGAQAAGQMSANDMTLGQLLGGAGLQTGTSLANMTGQTGSNIANLFGSQGVFGASSLLNTGAAQSSNIMQSAAIQAQIAAANAASQSANSAGGGGGDKGGAGQMLGQAGSLIGGFV